MDTQIKMYLARLLTLDRGILSQMEADGFTAEDTRLVKDEIQALEKILIQGLTPAPERVES